MVSKEPEEGSIVSHGAFQVMLQSSRPLSDALVTVNGAEVALDGRTLRWRCDLAEGPNRLEVVARDPVGNESKEVVELDAAGAPPEPTIDKAP